VRVKKAKLQGKITLPSSKSQTLRAILFAAMASGGSEIHRPLFSPDAYAMMEACRHFGAKIEVKQEYIEIAGIGGKVISTEDVIQAGNSGIVLRFCSALGALGNHPIVVTGDHSIRHLRLMKPLLLGIPSNPRTRMYSQVGVSGFFSKDSRNIILLADDGLTGR
jgi:3-phosphoshikimate 1-carboxyvinyltransferase